MLQAREIREVFLKVVKLKLNLNQQRRVEGLIVSQKISLSKK